MNKKSYCTEQEPTITSVGGPRYILQQSMQSAHPGHILRSLMPRTIHPRAGLKPARGQAMVLIALCMLALVAFVGLAVDGGSLYLQRRTAQNAADGASLAG